MEKKESIIVTRKSDYFTSKRKVYCIGSKEKAEVYKEDGATILSWTQAPDPAEYDQISELRLLPTKSQLSKLKFPDYVKDLEHLHFLEIPLPFLSVITQDDLPGGLKALTISNDGEHEEWVTKKLPEWPGIVLPHLKALFFFSAFTSKELPSLLNISQEHFPALKYLACRMDKKGNILKDIAKFSTLDHLEVEFAWNTDLIDHINSPLKALSIIGAEKNFNVNDLSKLQELQTVWLNGIKAPIDCTVFTTLPDLLEVNVLNSKKIEHPEALLDCKKLKSLFFLNCGQPFKKIKDQFLPENFEQLRIKHA
ncbi:hypothetical protein [Chitinophaga pinensis]|uniref:Leucine-rich repeat domain-containing protein n=1 Tax=Chitinophaga pinensis (strain ATCC 43595 / DSM 2588 / LMG 13176 / NBRC 15968 / NCIMB 11800 / UQM 2034) TaxID=485918 RepID=A0A979GAK3_CHIPD|nr:hypothetical protein [Chitinophaga pinensis]ACU63823.1 hypothetical protein Cpin_6419 [Chitinophaga pinensis DSM 2588]